MLLYSWPVRHRRISVVLPLILGFNTPLQGQSPSSLTATDVLQIWQQYQDRVQSARFTWTETMDYTPDSLQYAAEMGLDRDGGERLPPDTGRQRIKQCDLAIDGNRLRYAFEGDYWDSAKGEYRDRTYIAVFDGDVAQQYFSPGRVYGKLVISANAVHQDVGNVHLKPLTLACRALGTSLLPELNPPQCTLAREVGYVDGRACRILERSLDGRPAAPSDSRKNQWWIEPERGLFVRYVSIRSAKPAVQVDVSYKEEPSFGWLPSGWKIARFAGDTVTETITATVTSASVNEPIPLSEFRIEDLPTGTWIEDRRDDTDTLIRANGTRRPILAADHRPGVTFEDLMNSEPGQAGLTPRSALRRWAVYGSIVGVLCLGVWSWKRLRASQVQ